MIIVRDDDVLIRSSSFKSPFNHFQTVHNWICEVKQLLHVPAILVTEIAEFPEAIEYIKDQTKAGLMRPEIHGLEHIDYGKLQEPEIRDHLSKCKDFIYDNFGTLATTFYTPWGANAPQIYQAADSVDLKVTDCSRINKLAGRYGIVQRMRDGEDPAKFLEGEEIFFHWWEGGLRLRRVVEVLKHGTWAAAKAANEDWFE